MKKMNFHLPSETGSHTLSYMAIPGLPIVGGEGRMKYITYAVCAYFDISYSQIIMRDRSRKIIYPRQLAMYLIRKKTNLSFKRIGEYFGGKDHTSVIHSIAAVKDLLFYDETVKDDLRNINISILR